MLASNGEKISAAEKARKRRATTVKKLRTLKVAGKSPERIIAQNGEPIIPEPNTYYWALFYGEKEIVLTAPHNANYFYLHGDEYMRKVDSAGVQLVKKIWTRK